MMRVILVLLIAGPGTAFTSLVSRKLIRGAGRNAERVRGNTLSRIYASSMFEQPASSSSSSSFRVAFQGEPGAYSEKACRELLGEDAHTIGKGTFEEAFQAVASRDVDYALLPIENSLGGSIHTNYDLLLRYNLYIVGEHTLRVRHCLLALPGTKKSDIKVVMSHPQALAQCDNYLRGMGVKIEPKYDTAGSAKFIKEGNLEGCAAIASDLAGKIYGMDVLECGIEDDEVNFTRFILLARQPVGALIPPGMSAKTTTLFLIDNKAGSLYKALACFALRDIDLTKCESRPTSVQLLNYLAMSDPSAKSTQTEEQRFRYCFYLDYIASELDPNAQAALAHLREQSKFVRVLGSYPSDSQLVGPIKAALAALKETRREERARAVATGDRLMEGFTAPVAGQPPKLNIGLIGFGSMGQHLAATFLKYADVCAVDKDVSSAEAASKLGVTYYPMHNIDSFMRRPLDVIVLCVPPLSFEDTLRSLSPSDLKGKLVVDTLNMKQMPKAVMEDLLGTADADFLLTNPVFDLKSAWQSSPLVYEKVRVADFQRCAQFLAIFEAERCFMLEMSAEMHDRNSLRQQLTAQIIGRMLNDQELRTTPIDAACVSTALELAQSSVAPFDDFFALYKATDDADAIISSLREALSGIEKRIAAKEAYMSAEQDFKRAERQEIIREIRASLQAKE